MDSFESAANRLPARPDGFFGAFERIARASMVLAGWSYVAITVLVCFDIFARRVLGFSSGATTELSGYLMAAGMTLGLAGTLIERGHVRIDVLLQRMPLRIRVGFHVASVLALVVVSGFYAWGAVALAWDSYELGATDVSELRIPLVLPQGVWAAGLVLMLLAAVAVCTRLLRLALGGQLEAADAAMKPRTDIDEAEDTLEAVGRHEEAVHLAATLHHEADVQEQRK